jgi:hypothetical protein
MGMDSHLQSVVDQLKRRKGARPQERRSWRPPGKQRTGKSPYEEGVHVANEAVETHRKELAKIK